jgi:hypothetical protein
MSEAVTYLIRVAADAGLGGIARKLQSVRDSIRRARPDGADSGNANPPHLSKPN